MFKELITSAGMAITPVAEENVDPLAYCATETTVQYIELKAQDPNTTDTSIVVDYVQHDLGYTFSTSINTSNTAANVTIDSIPLLDLNAFSFDSLDLKSSSKLGGISSSMERDMLDPSLSLAYNTVINGVSDEMKSSMTDAFSIAIGFYRCMQGQKVNFDLTLPEIQQP